jgi:hypothetical protein
MLSSRVNQERKSESGNVLFLILIAVALFAALSYAVTQSTRSGGGDASRETTLVNAASITQYPASVKTAITRMVVSNSINPDDLLFDPPSTFSSLTGASVENQGVFYPASATGGGGGATYTESPANVMANVAPGTWHFNAENEIKDIGITIGGGAPDATSADVIAFLPGVSQSVCQSIHAKLGLSTTIPAIAGDIEYTLDMDYALWSGNSNSGILTGGTGGTITHATLDAQPQGCFLDGTTYVYYHVLVER